MTNFSRQVLRPGGRFSLRNQAYELTFVNAVSVRYASCQGGRPFTMPTETFWQLVDQNIVGFLGEEIGPIAELDGEYHHWQLTELQRCEMLRRYKYVKFALIGQRPHSKENLRRTITYVARENDDPVPPGRSTLSKWIKLFVEADQSFTVLVPRHDRKGPNEKKFPLEVEAIIARSIKNDYLTVERCRVSQLHCNIVGRVLEDLDRDGVAMPSVRTIYRRVKEFDPYVVALKRYGPKYAERNFRAAGSSIEATRLMEKVMIDGHRMDLIIVDPDTGEILGRPFLVCLLDVFTRCVVGWHISLLPFCATTALAAIKDMCSRNPLDRPGGIPEAIVPDNGRDLASAALRNLCSKISMHVEPAKTYCPDDKAHLERFFRTLNTQLIHQIPGTTFSSPTERDEYDSTAGARTTLSELKRLFSQWVEQTYHVHIHSATQRAPMLAWRDHQAEMPILSLSPDEINVIARIVYKRRICNGRVTVGGLSYKSDALATLEHRGTQDVFVLVDELNLGYVFVQHDSAPKTLYKADGIRPGYMTDLTQYEHDEVKKRIKELTRQDLEELGQHAYEISRWKLWCEIHDLSRPQCKRKLRLLTDGKGRNQVAMAKAKISANHFPRSPSFLEAPINSQSAIGEANKVSLALSTSESLIVNAVLVSKPDDFGTVDI